ncbi:MAG: RimK/LysX family protein [Marivibrio sp.]|uniref:ATP-dependent zinc protease family protein n=1 Tax=Marivibrio sp. TaxID=2039719 RepID=UPI0032F03956
MVKPLSPAQALCVAAGFLTAAAAAAPTPAQATPGQYVMGWIEQIRLPAAQRVFNAKLDTGATTSSVDARDIETFSRDEEEWVSFVIPGRDGADDIRLEREIARDVEIIQQDGEMGEHRYVVILSVCLNGTLHNAQFTLADREAFDEQFLLGRRLMEDVAVVHSGEKFLTEPGCSGS